MSSESNKEKDPCEIEGAKFVRERITELRLKNKISEYKLSYMLGNSRNYIRNITSGQSLPTLGQFFKICDSFDITPAEFFDKDLHNPSEIKDLMKRIELLNEKQLDQISSLVDLLNGEN